MRQTLDIINALEADGTIGRYAIAGAIAAYNYIEAALTEDLNILIAFEGSLNAASSGIVTLTPILSSLARRGYTEFTGDGLIIEGWPVQFLPVASRLEAEALEQAVEIDIQLSAQGAPVRARFLKPEHLVAMAVQVGRPKDRLRVAQFLSEEAVDLERLGDVVERHSLLQTWRAFCSAAGLSQYGQFPKLTMKPPDTTPYPDRSDIYRLKDEARKERARLSFGEKISRMEALRERVAPIKRAREARRGAQRVAADPKPPE